jgi:hypothetical protein
VKHSVEDNRHGIYKDLMQIADKEIQRSEPDVDSTEGYELQK